MRFSQFSLFRAVSAPLFAVLALGASAQAVAQTSSQTVRSRITAAIDSNQRVTLSNTRSARAVAAFDQGAVEADKTLDGLELVFSMSDAQQTDLNSLLAAQQDSTSAQYHQWLTPAQFASRFGMSDSDLQAAESWLSSQGFSVQGVSADRLGITFSGTVAQVQNAFGTSLHYYKSSEDTVAHYAPAADLTVPAALSSVVTGVRHLSSFRPQPHLQRSSTYAVHPNYTSSQTGIHFLTPSDVATIYNIKSAYSAGYNGSGQTIAVIGQSAIVASDITNFQSAAGLTVKAPLTTLVPGSGTSQIYTSDESESDLDLEYAGGIATGATINFVYVGSSTSYGVFDALKYAITNKIGQVITLSYGECELTATTDYPSMETALKQAASQGQTFVNSSGDDGSTSCAGQSGATTVQQQTLNASYPASSAYAVAVGGTEFPSTDTASSNTTYWSSASGSDVISSALSYIPEQVWNDDTASTSLANSLSSGGGGLSTLFNRPTWQSGVTGTPTGFYRMVPDISLASSPSYPGYLYCTSDSTSTGVTGSCSNGFRDVNNKTLTVGGGTSFAAPIFAGLVAIINQAKGYTTGQGLVAPTLYAMASNSTVYASAFHDITSGGNECTVGVSLCGSGNANLWYTASTGYDMASGLGSPNFYNMLTTWGSTTGAATAKSFTLAASPTTLTVSAGATGTATITVTPANGYTGTVAWSVSASPTLQYACYTLPTATVSSTTAVTATLTFQASNSSCQAGAYLKSTGTTISANHAPAAPASGKLPAGLALAGLLATGYLGRRSRKLKGLVAMGLLMVGGLSLTGCSGGTTGSPVGGPPGVPIVSQTVTNTPKATYTLTITGTDTSNSTITASTTLSVVVD